MKERTLVCMIFRSDCVCLRTVSRSRKSPSRFYISAHRLEELEHRSEIIAQDIHSFAVLRRDSHTGMLRIEFTWLKGDDDALAGYQDNVILPYNEFMEHLHESRFMDKPIVWKTLSKDDTVKQARIIFKSRKNLHAALENKIIRRKLNRFLRSGFRWAYAEKIEIYDDFMPYSFFFREISGGELGICGGIILHGQEDMKTAYYSMHT